MAVDDLFIEENGESRNIDMEVSRVPDNPPTTGGPQPIPNAPRIFKMFDPNRDVILNKERVVEQELFYPSKAIGKPFNSGMYSIVEVPAEVGFEAYNSPTFHLQNANSGVTYLSCMRGESGSYSTNGNVMTYRNMVSLTTDDGDGDYFSNDPERSVPLKIESLDIISVARDFYKDGLDMDYFGLALSTGSGVTVNTSYGTSYDNTTDELVGLFPSNDYKQTPMGKKYFLYRYTSVSDFYDSVTDTFLMPNKSSLDYAGQAFGEVYPDQGIIVLYLDVLETEYPTLVRGTSALNYVALLGGNSRSKIFSNVYFVRLGNEEFNYTTNPTAYRDDDPSILKTIFAQDPKTFPTSIGFHNADGDLIAYAKLSKPFEKNFSDEAIIRAEMGY